MSWTLMGTVKESRIEGLMGTPQVGYAAEESKAQMEAAEVAMRSLIESGAWGEGEFGIVMSGHANPGHVPESGWSPDYVTINVQKR